MEVVDVLGRREQPDEHDEDGTEAGSGPGGNDADAAAENHDRIENPQSSIDSSEMGRNRGGQVLPGKQPIDAALNEDGQQWSHSEPQCRLGAVGGDEREIRRHCGKDRRGDDLPDPEAEEPFPQRPETYCDRGLAAGHGFCCS